MARYVERDCSDCGVLVAANELIPWQEKQLSGTSRRSGFRTGVRGGVGFSSGGSKRYRHVNLKLCRDCVGVRIEAARRARFWANMRGLVTFGAIVAAVVAFINVKPSRLVADNATYLTGASNAADEDGNAIRPVTALGDDRAANANVDVQAQRVPEERAGSQDPVAEPSDMPPDDLSSSRPSAAADEVETAMTAAMPDALETGQPQRWSASGKTGYVVPSTVQAYADRSCRNVYATIIEGRAQTQSQSRQWCRLNDGGEWKPAP